MIFKSEMEILKCIKNYLQKIVKSFIIGLWETVLLLKANCFNLNYSNLGVSVLNGKTLINDN